MSASTGKAWRPLRIGLALAVLAAVLGGVSWAAWRARQEMLLVQCTRNVGEIRRFIWQNELERQWPQDEKGRRLWPPSLEGVPEALITCPATGKRYVYSPVTPSGVAIDVDAGGTGTHFVLWCPTCAHMGKRVFMLDNMFHWTCGDADVRWETQTIRGWGPTQGSGDETK